MLRHWRSTPLPELLAANGLAGVDEEPFDHDGWSGARLTRLRAPTGAYILKRTSWALDWIARATLDHTIREAFVAGGQMALPAGVAAPHLGAAADGGAAAMLMPDLTGVLLAWGQPVDRVGLDRVVAGMAALHAAGEVPDAFPWCPARERLELLGAPAARRYRAGGLGVGDRFLEGWAAFDRLATPSARDLVGRLTADARPLVAALDRLPHALLHGDLKLANVGFIGETMVLIDWQMAARAPVAMDLGWFLVANVATLPVPPEAVLERYRVAAAAAGTPVGDWNAQVDLAWLTGLVLRGWRKGLDAEAGLVTGWGASGADDLAWWSERAAAAADRRL